MWNRSVVRSAWRSLRAMPRKKKRVITPVVEFFYTIDQLALMLSVPLEQLDQVVHFRDVPGRSYPNDNRIPATRCLDLDGKNSWRVTHSDFLVWCFQNEIEVVTHTLAVAPEKEAES